MQYNRNGKEVFPFFFCMQEIMQNKTGKEMWNIGTEHGWKYMEDTRCG